MTLDQLVKKLASWKTDLENMSANLTALEEGAGFKTAKVTQLTGETDTKCHEAFTTVETLWEYLKLVRDVVEKADAAHKTVGLFNKAAVAEEMNTLLNGQSIQLSLVHVPAHERGLLGSATQRQTTTPDDLKKTMVEVYARASKFFTDLRTRWLALVELSSKLNGELETLGARVNQVGKPKPSELSDVEARLSTFDKNRLTNPLSIEPARFENEMKGYFSKARIVIQKMEHDRESIGKDVQRAYTRLEEVRIARTAAMEAQKRADDKVTGVSIEQPPKTKDLVDQLETIKTALSQKKFAEVESGLDNWNREATRLEDLYKETARRMEELLQKVANLKSRMDAAKRKRQDNADKGLNSDKALDKFAAKFGEADGEKFDVAAADMAVTSYETRLAGVIAAWDAAPQDVRLKRRLDKAKEDAEANGFGATKALTSFARAAEDALAGGKLDIAENHINSYEVKLAELKVNPPKSNPPTAPAPATAREEPAPAVDRKTALAERLAQAKSKAEAAGHGEDKALGKFAAKASEHLSKDELDGAETMVYSYETRQAELAAKPHVEPAQTEAPTVESLRKRLTDAQARASQDNVNPSKALKAFAEKAEEALAQGDLKKAEDMILSYETRLSELLAHGQN
jgi:hypothetical protein